MANEDEDEGKGKGARVEILDHSRPLDSLLPELRGEGDRMRAIGAVHDQVLGVETEEGSLWLLNQWSASPTSHSLRAELRAMLEATQLSWLSLPPSKEEQIERDWRALQLLVWPDLPAPQRRMLESFSLVESNIEDWSDLAARLAPSREEAARLGLALPERPAGLWELPVLRPDRALVERMEAIHARLAKTQRREVWGEQPGWPSKQLADLLMEHFQVEIQPNLEGLASLELLLVDSQLGGLRWMPPLIFQAICDFLAVLGQVHYGAEVAWGLCERDDQGYYPPPLLRRGSGAGAKLLPIGLELMRWVVMPLRATPMPLAERFDRYWREND